MAKPLTPSEIDALPLSPADKARLYAHYGHPLVQSRAAGAYEGAKIASKVPDPKYTFTGTGPAAGKKFVATPEAAQIGAARGYIDKDEADRVWAETQGGPIAGVSYPSEKYAIGYSANVPAPGGGTAPLYMQTAKPAEVTPLVKAGVITPETEQKIYAAKNAEDPMQQLVIKTPPAPGMDYAPSARAVPDEAFAAPLPAGKPTKGALLPGVPIEVAPVVSVPASKQPLAEDVMMKPGPLAKASIASGKALDAFDDANERFYDASVDGIGNAVEYVKKKGKK